MSELRLESVNGQLTEGVNWEWTEADMESSPEEEDVLKWLGSIGSGAASGAALGAAGGPVGALVGAVVGGGLGAIQAASQQQPKPSQAARRPAPAATQKPPSQQPATPATPRAPALPPRPPTGAATPKASAQPPPPMTGGAATPTASAQPPRPTPSGATTLGQPQGAADVVQMLAQLIPVLTQIAARLSQGNAGESTDDISRIVAGDFVFDDGVLEGSEAEPPKGQERASSYRGSMLDCLADAPLEWEWSNRPAT